MPTGVSTSDNYANAPTDLPGFGDIQWESMSGRDYSRAQVGGPDYEPSGFGTNSDTGFNRIVTDNAPSEPIPGAAGNRVTDWHNALNPQSPTLWLMLFALAAVGLIHARVNTKFGPAHADVGLG